MKMLLFQFPALTLIFGCGSTFNSVTALIPRFPRSVALSDYSVLLIKGASSRLPSGFPIGYLTFASVCSTPYSFVFQRRPNPRCMVAMDSGNKILFNEHVDFITSRYFVNNIFQNELCPVCYELLISLILRNSPDCLFTRAESDSVRAGHKMNRWFAIAILRGQWLHLCTSPSLEATR